MAIAGCRSYQRNPLELDDYARRWKDRALEVESIEGFAATLAEVAPAERPFDSSDGLSLQEGIAVALRFNPQLRVRRAAAKVSLAGAEEAGWWPDPQAQAQLLRFVNRGDKTRFRVDGPRVDGINAGGPEVTPLGFRRVEGDFIDDPWIVGLGLQFTIPLSGRVAVEEDLRWTQYSAAWRRILVQEWRVVTEVQAKWLEWSSASERLALTEVYVVELEKIAEMTGHLVEAGEMKPTEGRLLHIELARRRAQLLSLRREEIRNRVALFGMMGLVPDCPLTLQAQVAIEGQSIPPGDRAALVLSEHPQVKAAEADYEAAEQQLRLEIRRQYPDLSVGPNYSFEEGFSRLGVGLGLPIPLWNRNRQAIAEAAAMRERARIEAQVAVERALSSLAQVELDLRFASERRRALLEEVAPLVQRQVEDSRTLLELGEIDVLLLRDALTGSLETKLELIDASLAEQRAANELQQMLRPVWVTPSQAESEEG